MTCAECPYSLRCLMDDLQRQQCRYCGRVVVMIEPPQMFDVMRGEYVDQEEWPGHFALIRCPSPAYEQAGVVTMGCAVCVPQDPLWTDEGVIIEDLSDL